MIRAYKLDKERLQTDKEYSIEASAKILFDIKKKYGKIEPYTWWSRYHSRSQVLRFRYTIAVNRWRVL